MKRFTQVAKPFFFAGFPLVALVAIALMFSGCSQPIDPWAGTPEGQPRVLALFPPLYCFAANVAKDRANILCLSTGMGPHDYQPSDIDARKVAGADLFLVNGVGLEDDFIRNLLRMARNRKVKDDPIGVGDAIDPKLLERMAEHDHAAGDGHEHHHHGEHDPHVWLGPIQAQAMVAAVAKKLADLDPAHKVDYDKNADAYIGKLKDLEAYGREQFKDKKSKSFITMHESLRYFANGFGLDLVDSIQLRPGDEADANRLARLIEVCQKKNVNVIAVEPQYNSGQAENLARVLRGKGVNVKIALVDPMETAPPMPPLARGNPDPNFYLDRMKANIDALAKAFP